MTETLTVAQATDSADCDWPGCGREAERDGRCRYHAGRVPVTPPPGGEQTREWTRPAKPAVPKEKPEADTPPAGSPISHPCTVTGCKGRTRNAGELCSWHRQNGTPDPDLKTGFDPPPPIPEPEEPAVPDIVLCRVEGCTRASVAQSGPWKGWCGEHKHLRGKKADTVKPPPVDGQQTRTPAAPVSPPQSPEPAPAAAPEPPANGTLVTLAQAVQDTATALHTATEQHTRSVAALRAALDEAA